MKAIVFDLDNTLIEWISDYSKVLDKVLIDMGYNFSNDLVRKIDKSIDKNEKENITLTKESLLEFINSNCDLSLPMEFIDNLLLAHSNCVCEDKDLEDTIKYLSQKYDLFVITNYFTSTQTKRLEKMNIAKYFKKIIGADINYYKPYPKSFDVVLNQYEASECLSIGDSLENDIQLPKSKGMNVIWKTNEKSEEYKTIKHIKELKDIL